MRRVLIVDDDRLVADTLTLIFKKSGFDAKTTYSADEAMQCARGFRPELLVSDITMPGRDGLSLVRDISHELPSCHIIVLTGIYSNVKNVREQAGKLSRQVDILIKPCPPSELLRQAQAALSTTSSSMSHV
jgi:DNA-binding response OmpR family regulator